MACVFQIVLTRFTEGSSFAARFVVASVLALAVWLVNFYGMLSWLQPLLFGGNWIVTEIPWWVAAVTHLVFGWTMLIVYPLGRYVPYRVQSEKHDRRREACRPTRRATNELVDERIVVGYFLAALAICSISMLGGLLMALQLVHWNPLRGIELLSPGRWRMIHTNAIAYGFLANAFLGALHWAMPRLTFRPVLDRRLS